MNKLFFIFLILLSSIRISFTQIEYCHTGESCKNSKCCIVFKGKSAMCCPFYDGICCENELCCPKDSDCNSKKGCVVMETSRDNNDRVRPDL